MLTALHEPVPCLRRLLVPPPRHVHRLLHGGQICALACPYCRIVSRYCEHVCHGFLKATELQVADWANAYARRGNTSGKTALSALLWVEAVTGESVFARSPLVSCHCRPALPHGMVGEKPSAANPPDVEVLRRFEHLVSMAPTAVQMCVRAS